MVFQLGTWTIGYIRTHSTCESLGMPGGQNTASQSCRFKQKDLHEPVFGSWWFGLSGADRAGDALDLLSARHRAAPPLVGPLAGLGVEILPRQSCLFETRKCRFRLADRRHWHPRG